MRPQLPLTKLRLGREVLTLSARGTSYPEFAKHRANSAAIVRQTRYRVSDNTGIEPQ